MGRRSSSDFGAVHRSREDVDLESNEVDGAVQEHEPLVVVHEEPAAVEKEAEEKVHEKPKRRSEKRRAGGTIVFLNGLRGLAALLVVGQHGNYFRGVKVAGFGVDSFFVLSSFLLTMIFERKSRQMLQQRATARQWLVMLADYFSKRFFRVYPLFAVVATTYALLPVGLRNQYLQSSPAHYDLFGCLTFKFEARYHVFWSLPVEIAYYFLIPIFVLGMVALRRLWWIVVLPACIWIVHDRSYWYQFRRNHQPLVAHLSTFIIGSLAAFIYGRINSWIQDTGFEFSKWQRLFIQSFEAAVAGVLLYCAFNEDPKAILMGNALLAVYTAIIMVIELVLPSPIARFFEWNFLVYAGKVSFSMYLLHSFVIYTPEIQHVHKYHRFLLDLGLTWLLSMTSYWMVEYPSQLGAQRVSKWLSGFNGTGPAVQAPTATSRHS